MKRKKNGNNPQLKIESDKIAAVKHLADMGHRSINKEV